MKKTYSEAELEIIAFDSEDVITTSGGFRSGTDPGDIGNNTPDIDFTNGGNG